MKNKKEEKEEKEQQEEEEEAEDLDENKNFTNNNSGVGGDGGGGSGGDGTGLSVAEMEEVGVRHASALLELAGDVPLDVARTVLAAHHRTLRAANASGRQRLTGGFIQCPSCSTPWIAGLCKPRLLGCPRDPKAGRRALRRILRRAQTSPGKLTSREKSVLTRYQNRENVIEVSCLVCRHKKREFFPAPERLKKEEEEEEGVEVGGGNSKRNMKKRKKKRKAKEINAGLHLPSSSSSSSSISSFSLMAKKKKKGRNEIRETSPSSSVFTTSTDTRRNTPDTQTNTFGTHRNTSAHPRFKPRAKVLIGGDSPGATLPHPASAATPGVARERRRTLANLKRIMSVEKEKSSVCSGGGKSTSSLSSFLESLF